MRVLSRAVLREVGGQAAFYAAIFLGVIALGVATPLIKQGAPVDAVAGFLIDQIPFFSLLVLPLAFVTAVLTAIGRMREEGELTALQAAGVSTWAIAGALLPLALLIAVWLGVAAHLLLPRLTFAVMAGQDDLMRQAIAAQVGRRKPIINNGIDELNAHVIVSANAVAGDRLRGVFAALRKQDGELMVCYAPQARLVARPEGEAWVDDRSDKPAAVGLELEDARLLLSGPPEADGSAGQITTGVLARWVVGVPGRTASFANEAEVMPTGAIAAQLGAGVEDPRRRRALQLAWHLRWMLPVAVLGQWLFACGVGLAMGRGNRLVAAVTGALVVVGNLAISYGAAKELARATDLHPGWFVWTPGLILAAIGAWLLWRHR